MDNFITKLKNSESSPVGLATASTKKTPQSDFLSDATRKVILFIILAFALIFLYTL